MSGDLSNWIIASATFGNFVAYFLLSRQTKALFLESNAPLLSVTLRNCEYSETDGGLRLRIVITNLGTVAANQVKLSVSFGGSNDRKDIQNIAIPPKDKIPYTFVLRMTRERYATGQLEGNRFNAIIEGSYTGLAGKGYAYKARQDYDPQLRRFVPIRMNW